MNYAAASVLLGPSLDTLTRFSLWATIIGVVGAWIRARGTHLANRHFQDRRQRRQGECGCRD